MVGKEVSASPSQVSVWLGKMEGPKDSKAPPAQPFVLNLPALRDIHVSPATEADDEVDLHWGKWW